MAWGNKGKSSGGTKKSTTSVRLTGLFKTKKKGLLVGKLREEDVKGLAKLVKKALTDEKEIVIFAYREEDDKRLYSLSADIAQEQQGGSGGRKNYSGGKSKSKIEDDEDDAPEGDEDDNDGDEGHDDKDDDIDL